jgi:hypothetical protein
MQLFLTTIVNLPAMSLMYILAALGFAFLLNKRWSPLPSGALSSPQRYGTSTSQNEAGRYVQSTGTG